MKGIRRLVLASRGSRLALAQASRVAEMLRRAHPELDVEVSTVSTRGDRDTRPFREIGGKGLFVKEVERALFDGRADAAVHSAKDLTAELAEGCDIVCLPERTHPHDIVVGGDGSDGRSRLASLAPGARVGTSSMRRRSLLAEARPDVEMVELRGNIDTRLRKVAEKEADAAILAAAGLERLGHDHADGALDSSWWVPAPAQGALAVEALSERSDVAELFAALDDPAVRAEVTCERAFAAQLEGGCSVPLGCLARESDHTLVVTGYLGDPSGGHALRDRISGPASSAARLGRELAEAILGAGGDDILAAIRELDTPPISPP
ncbi:MAG: hydroxymethylbilane synthase [Actinomycetota bacterium]